MPYLFYDDSMAGAIQNDYSKFARANDNLLWYDKSFITNMVY
jgi:hypothetical protein